MNRFLIVRLGSLGDVVHAIPAAAALRESYPHGLIDWVVDPRYLDLVGLVDGVDHGLPLDPRAAGQGQEAGGPFGTVRRLRRTRYDAVFDLQGLLKSAVLARAAGGSRTIGFPRAHLREPLARLFYTETADPGAEQHVVRKNLSLLAAVDVVDRQVRFPLTIPRTNTVRSIVDRFGADGFALVNPGAAWPNKRWLPARFGETAAALRHTLGLRSVVLWGPGEQQLAAEVAANSQGAAEPLPQTSIVDIVGVAREARVMLSGDTGPLHLAAAVGTPVVALFGPTRAERNGPWDEQDATLSRTGQCTCLYQRVCRKAEPCINDITVDEVVGAIQQRLGTHD